jgi:protein TonB
MTEAGFFAPRQNSPGSLTMVILLHAAVLAAVIMIKAPQFIRPHIPPLVVQSYPVDRDPPREPRPQPRPEQRSQIAQPEQVIRTEQTTQTVTASHDPPPQTQFADAGETVAPPRQPDPPAPVRRGAELDPRYAGQLQPPYPAAEQRAQREGRVQVRVTIAPSGRVSAVARLMATSDAFWRVTEQQALNHWRFRPATVDGRPVEGSKVMTLIFRIENAV